MGDSRSIRREERGVSSGSSNGDTARSKAPLSRSSYPHDGLSIGYHSSSISITSAGKARGKPVAVSSMVAVVFSPIHDSTIPYPVISYRSSVVHPLRDKSGTTRELRYRRIGVVPGVV